MSFIGFIIYSSIGGSETSPFDFKQGQPEYEDTPGSVDVPRSNRDGFNLSDFAQPPEGLNPPADLVGDTGNLGNQDPPDFTPPDNPDQQPGEIPDFPNQDNPQGPNQPGSPGGGIDFPDRPRGNNPPQDPNSRNVNRSRDPISFPDRPNKAANLWNLSSIELFPDTNNSISININFPTVPLPGFNNITFFLVIISVFYLPQIVVRRILEEISDTEASSADGQKLNIFFKPEQSEIEKKREEERRKMLLNLDEHINMLIEEINNKRESEDSAKDIITWTYLRLDEAFSNFMTLKRDKDLTPLEHAKLSFESHEIDNEALTNIVDLFYRTRFGNKDLGDEKVDQLITLLSMLVKGNSTEDTKNSKSRWSIF